MTASPDDRTAQVADAAPSTAKKTPARKTPAKKATSARTPAKAAADKAAATIEVVAEPALKIDPSADPSASRSATAKTTTSVAARTAAAKNSARPSSARGTAAKATAARPAAAKATAAKATAAKTTAAKTTAAKTTAAKTTAAKTTAAKTVAAKAAAEKSAAAKSTARTSAAKTASARTVAAKTAAAKAAAAKAAAAKAAEAEADQAKAAEAEAEAEAAAKAAQERAAAETRAAEATAVLADVTVPAAEGLAQAAPVVEHARGDDVDAPSEESPTVDAAPVEGATSDIAEVDEEAVPDEPAHENPVSDIDEPVSDADATEEAVSGVEAASASEAIRIRGLVKSFGDHTAVNGIDLTVPAGSFYGIVGPNGAGKTTTLSIVAGLLRSDEGSVVICGIDQAAKPLAAKRMMGVLPDRLRTFDRLTGRQLLYYYGLLRGLASNVIEKRVGDLARAFDLGEALNRVVSDYSAGMTKKIMLAGAMIHSPRVLVLDEPFEAVDPVSSAVILDILRAYVDHGGTVILSSHGMDLVARVCSRVAIIVGGEVLAEGTIDEVRAGQTLEARFVELSGGISEVEGLEWLHTFSD